MKTLFKDTSGNWSWTRVRGAITLLIGLGLAFYLGYKGTLDQWSVILILGLCGFEVAGKTIQKKLEQ